MTNPMIECDKAYFSVSKQHFNEARVVAMQAYGSDNNIYSAPRLIDLVRWAHIKGYDYNVIPFN